MKFKFIGDHSVDLMEKAFHIRQRISVRFNVKSPSSTSYQDFALT